jgi:hypothetical protein
MAEEVALETGAELLGGGEAAAATEAAAPTITAAEAAAPAAITAEAAAPTTAEIGLDTAATSTIPVSAELSASGVPLSQGAPTVQGVQDYLSTAPVSSANALPTAAETSEAIASEQASEMSQEEFAKKMAENEAAYASTAATTEAPNAVDKALRYLGVTSANGIGPTALPLATLGISQYRANKQAQAIKDQLAAASAQTKGVATSLLDKYQTGTIDANQQKQIDDLTNNTKARIKQRYAQMGRDPNTDSAAQSELAKADADAVAMQDAAKQGILTQGLNAAGLAQGPATSAVMAGYQSDLQQQQAMQNFMNTLALMQSKREKS